MLLQGSGPAVYTDVSIKSWAGAQRQPACPGKVVVPEAERCGLDRQLFGNEPLRQPSSAQEPGGFIHV